MRRGLEQYLEWHRLTTLEEARGTMSLQMTSDPSSFERAHYIRTLHRWTR